MNWLKGMVLALGLVAPLLLAGAGPVSAEMTTPASKSEKPSADASKVAATPVKADEDKDDTSKTSETDKRAKAIECSKQADAKKLHGEARKKFRSSCKRAA